MPKLAYTVPEVAEMLGCSQWTVYRAITRGELPIVTFVGSRKLVPALGLEEYVRDASARLAPNEGSAA